MLSRLGVAASVPAIAVLLTTAFATAQQPPAGSGSRQGTTSQPERSTRDIEPMHVAHEESPFEEPLSEYTAAAMTVEAPVGMHIEEAPSAAEVPAPIAAPEAPVEDVTSTITMADLYARQGLTDDARQIYETILARDPNNDEVRAKLDALTPRAAETTEPSANEKVARLEGWLSKVSRKEVRDV